MSALINGWAVEDTWDQTTRWVTLAGTSFPQNAANLKTVQFYIPPESQDWGCQGFRFECLRSAPDLYSGDIFSITFSECKSISLVGIHHRLRIFASFCTLQRFLPLNLLTSQNRPCINFCLSTLPPTHCHLCSLVRLVAKHSSHIMANS